jgi:hypothetical protein
VSPRVPAPVVLRLARWELCELVKLWTILEDWLLLEVHMYRLLPLRDLELLSDVEISNIVKTYALALTPKRPARLMADVPKGKVHIDSTNSELPLRSYRSSEDDIVLGAVQDVYQVLEVLVAVRPGQSW